MKLMQKLAVGYIRTKLKIMSAVSPGKTAEKAFEIFCTPHYQSKKIISPVLNNAEKLEFDLEGTMVKGYRWNAGHPAKTMILHGFESTVTNFERYVKPLVEHENEVIAFDAPGHGRSGGKTITAPLYSKMIVEVYRHYGPIRNFIAHSFGCLGLALALEEIEHDENYRVTFMAPAIETTTAVNSFFDFLRLEESVRKEFEKVIIEKGGKPTAWYSINRALKSIKAKILWVHDENDEVTPLSDAKNINKENYPNIEFYITEGLGHSRIYRDPNVIKKVVDFLTGKQSNKK